MQIQPREIKSAQDLEGLRIGDPIQTGGALIKGIYVEPIVMDEKLTKKRICGFKLAHPDHEDEKTIHLLSFMFNRDGQIKDGFVKYDSRIYKFGEAMDLNVSISDILRESYDKAYRE